MLKRQLNELRLFENSPKLFIIDHFDVIRNQIDIECETYLNGDEISFSEKQKAIQQQEEMVEEIDRLQTKCLENLKLTKAALYQRKKQLLMEQGIVFVDKKCELSMGMKEINGSFGALIIVKDDYVPFLKISR